MQYLISRHNLDKACIIESNFYLYCLSDNSYQSQGLRFKTFVRDSLLFTLGGLVILVARENDVLEDEGKWTMLEKRVFPGYLSDIDGVVFVFRITK